MNVVDLRSDTVTKPTAEMIEAMARAEVGDDNYGEDPTVNRLEELAADMVGKEAALLVPTGTMGNQIAVFTHTSRGDEIIADFESHIFTNEMCGPAVFSSVLVRPVTASGGVLCPEDIVAVVRPRSARPRTSLLCIENTHNWAGGVVTSVERMNELCRTAKNHGMAVHVDGARLFNASVALGVPAAEIVGLADSVMFCLSKGLSAPAGSILAGSKEFVSQARAHRKLMGGQMRQAGYLAACGIVALTRMVDRMAEDHARAKQLAAGLAALTGIKVETSNVQTNIVVFDISGVGCGARLFLSELAALGVKAYAFNDSRVRMMPTRHTSDEDVRTAVSAVCQVAETVCRGRRKEGM